MFETVLQRVLKAVFGGGADIDIKAAQDALQSIQLEHRVGRSLNDFFNARTNPRVDGAYLPNQRVENLDELWTADGYKCPAGYGPLATYSRKVFQYPILGAYGTLPPMDGGTEFSVWIGFETGAGARTPIVALHEMQDKCYFQGHSTSPEITSLLPADYATHNYIYTIKVNKQNGELWIEEPGIPHLRGVILYGLREAIPTWENNPPYALASYPAPLSASMPAFLEASRGGEEIVVPISSLGNNFVAADGDPLPPRQYALYTESTATKWTGLAPGAVITSHPVPVWGYPVKTLVFQATAAGNLDIQAYVGGGWRSWVPGGITLVANQLEVYNLNGDVPIIRCVYTRVAAETITVAEAYIS